MSDATQHLIFDTNLLIFYLHPLSVDSKRVKERCKILFDAATQAAWSGLRIYVPAISVAEAIGVATPCGSESRQRKHDGNDQFQSSPATFPFNRRENALQDRGLI